MELVPTKMQFLYSDAFGHHQDDAYERLLLDVIRGDMTLFSRTDSIHASWTFITKILDLWKTQASLCPYRKGTWGPTEADTMTAKDDRHWFLPEDEVK